MEIWICCEDCGEPVEAERTHNGVLPVLHYICCGWGHQAGPDDGFDTPEAAVADREYWEERCRQRQADYRKRVGSTGTH